MGTALERETSMKDLETTVILGAYCSVDFVHLPAGVLDKLREGFTFKNPAYAKARAMGFKNISEPQKYFCFNEDGGRFNCWRGGAKRLKSILNTYGIKVNWVDQRKSFKPVGLKLGSLEPFPEQLVMAKEMIRYQQGIGIGRTGMGKTETALTAAVMADQPTLIVVWNKDLLAQWEERIIKYGILPKKEIGIIQGPKNKFGLITLAMIQSLYKRVDDWTGKFGTVIMDECQRAPARTFIEGLTPFPAKYRWGISADPERRDKKHFLAYECFGYQEWNDKTKIPKYSPIAIAQGEDQTLEPTIKVIATEYEDEEYERERNFGGLVNRLVIDEKRNALIAHYLRKELEAGKQCILFTERVETARHWSNLVSSWGIMAGPLIGGVDNATETKATITALQKGTCRFASTTSYADVGIDVPTLERAFITCPTGGNEKRLNQQVGRIVRPSEGKENPVAYYFWDKHIEGISKHIKKIRKFWQKVEEIDI